MMRMKIVAVMLILGMLVGCTNVQKGDKEEVATASFADIVTAIKEQVAEDFKADSNGEEVLVDGKLAYFMETDLTASEESDPAVAIWIEKMGLSKEEIAHGIVIAPMMNVNADEFIVLEAKDVKHVESLKTSLERELANQVQTWQQYLPEQYEKVKNNKIITNGNFLLYTTYSEPDKIEKVFNNSIN